MSPKNAHITKELGQKKVPLRDRIELDKLTVDQRFKYVKNLVVWHPKMKQLYDEIRKVHHNLLSNDEPDCMSLFGPTRVGKSTIANQYFKKHPSFDIEDKILSPWTNNFSVAEVTKIPVLYIRQIDVPASIGSIINSFLKSMGQPLPFTDRKLYLQTTKLKQLLVHCGTQLIILDEVQHFVDRNKKRLLSDSADWLKGLIIDTKIPIVLMGTLEAEKIFTNDQLEGRFKNNQKLFPFNCHEQNDRINFRKLLKTIDDSLPLKCESGLTNDDTWERIYLATEGKVGLVIDFIKRSVLLAFKLGAESLDHNILSKIYLDHYSTFSYCESNPFSPTFNIEKSFELDIKKRSYSNTYGMKTNNRGNKSKEL
ncbi:TniB family NTP-binding protein [Desulfotomaculum sp. 1211_IL3151]|uniref:TniB family NTP-binding protein n=1 Tax=Desulfotomaculum sp. 1211_IL3151 TaxID=3084055 RepID=UPI002FD8C558